jgi:hypothetical protein
MKKENWVELLDEAPNAVKDCLSYFEHRFMGQWKQMISYHRYLFQYFQAKGIQIHIDNKPGWTYSVTIDGAEKRKMVYGSLDKAEQEAILEAFKGLETKFEA